MIFLPLNLQLLTSTFLCNLKMAGANVEAVGAGCDGFLLWSLSITGSEREHQQTFEIQLAHLRIVSSC